MCRRSENALSYLIHWVQGSDKDGTEYGECLEKVDKFRTLRLLIFTYFYKPLTK